MNVSLTPELEQLVNKKVGAGMYQTASEVVREGLRLLQQRDQSLEALRQDVAAGFAAVERGQYSDFTAQTIAKLGDRVKARGRKQLAPKQLLR